MRTSLFCTALLALFLGGCATPAPDIRVQSSPTAEFPRYRTFAFFSPLGTDSSAYSSLLSQYLKAATRRSLEDRGYRFDEQQPDLLVNFNARVQDKTDVMTTPAMGYYGYRGGWYGPWGGYDTTVFQYQEGTLNVDLIDARQKQLVWEGVAEGQVSEAARKNLEASVNAAVAGIFARYPYRAGSR